MDNIGLQGGLSLSGTGTYDWDSVFWDLFCLCPLVGVNSHGSFVWGTNTLDLGESRASDTDCDTFILKSCSFLPLGESLRKSESFAGCLEEKL